MTNQYDAIIAGGRNAGSSFAIRLARQNLKVLLIDRASFPSSPIIHAGAVHLTNELGFDRVTRNELSRTTGNRQCHTL
jgi:flavin-dependent dehydrogenase